jgi:hypothetical protein
VYGTRRLRFRTLCGTAILKSLCGGGERELEDASESKNLRKGFSQVFRRPLCFCIMSEVVYEKNGVLLLFNVIFFTF